MLAPGEQRGQRGAVAPPRPGTLRCNHCQAPSHSCHLPCHLPAAFTQCPGELCLFKATRVISVAAAPAGAQGRGWAFSAALRSGQDLQYFPPFPPPLNACRDRTLSRNGEENVPTPCQLCHTFPALQEPQQFRACIKKTNKTKQ